MGRYLGTAGFGSEIGNFYAMQGLVSLFMPALMGIVADRWIPAQRLLGVCHMLAGMLMLGVFLYTQTDAPSYPSLFALYSLSVAFYMPTLALSNSVAYTSLDQAGLDLVKSFPPIRVFGTVGFICTMIAVSLLGLEATSGQFAVSAIISLVLAVYAQTLPNCPTAPKGQSKSLVEALGLRAFVLFKQRKMALFFIFSMLLGVSLQITNGFANPFISTFGEIPAYADTFGVKYANILISLSQLSETLCILLIPFALRRFGIRRVMLIAMVAWVLRFALLGLGNPGSGVWLFLLSMIVYGVAFDFFNVSGSLFVDKETDPSIRSSAQGSHDHDQWYRCDARLLRRASRDQSLRLIADGDDGSSRWLEHELVHLRGLLGCRSSALRAALPLQYRHRGEVASPSLIPLVASLSR